MLCFKKGFLNNVKKTEFTLKKELIKLQVKYPKIIKDIRGQGLLIGLVLFKDQTSFINRLIDHKLLQ